MGPAPEPRKPKVMRVSTRCRTIDELVAAFATLVDEHSLVVLTDQQRTIGSRQPFVVELADGTFVMKGEAEVVESTPPPRGRLRLRFLALDASGREVHQRMLERKQGTPPSRATLPFGMKPLVRIPEVVGAPRDPTPPPSPPPPKPAPPAPFARPVPSVPATPRAPSTVPVPVIPPRTTVHGPSLGARKLPAPPPVPSVPMPAVPSIPTVPRVPPIAGAAVKAPLAVPLTDSGSGLPSFEDPPDLADRTAVDTSLPELEPVVVAPPVAVAVPLPALSIEEAVAAVVAKPRAATAPVEGDRTPGSPYILPANPFGDVAPESLEAFVECTVYEETGQFAFGEDGLVNELAPLGDSELAPDPLTTPVFPMYGSEPAAPASPPPVIAPPPPVALLEAPSPGQVHPPPPPRTFTPPPSVSAAPMMPLAAPPDQQWPPFGATGSVSALDPDAPITKRPPWKWIGVGAAVIGAIVLIVVLTRGGGGEESRAAAGTGSGTGSPNAKGAPDAGARVAAIDGGVAVVAAPDAGAAIAAVVAETTPDAGVATPPPLISADQCHLTLDVEPEGAHIKLDGKKIGDAPIDAAIPCDAAPLTIVRSHYETVIKKLKPVPGEPLVINVKMVRPEVKVTITSTPPGAMIELDGKSLGKAPTSTIVKGYTRVKIEATLKGYQPWSKTLEVEKKTKKIVAPMKKVRSR